MIEAPLQEFGDLLRRDAGRGALARILAGSARSEHRGAPTIGLVEINDRMRHGGQAGDEVAHIARLHVRAIEERVGEQLDEVGRQALVILGRERR